jgi:tetratricopeptide (TPR) repeat protein
MTVIEFVALLAPNTLFLLLILAILFFALKPRRPNAVPIPERTAPERNPEAKPSEEKTVITFADAGRYWGQAVRGVIDTFRDETAPPKETVSSVTPGKDRLRVFVSSRQKEFEHDRWSLKSVIEKFGILNPWLFESTPASSQLTEEACREGVRECDYFVLIVGETISEAVKNEFEEAQKHNKPCLVFVKECARSEEAADFVAKLKMKQQAFKNNSSLRYLIHSALADQLIADIKRGLQTRLSALDLTKLVVFATVLRKLFNSGREEDYMGTAELAQDALGSFETGKYEEAAGIATIALDQSPKDAGLFALRGECYNQLGMHDQARNDWRRAVSLSPDNLDAWARIAYAEYDLYHFKKAIDAADKVLKIVDSQGRRKELKSHMYYIRGCSYLEVGNAAAGKNDLSRALTDADKVISETRATKPKLAAEALFRKARAYEALKEHKNAISTYESYIACKKNDVEALYYLGNLYTAVGSHSLATMAFNLCISIATSESKWRRLALDKLQGKATSYGSVRAGFDLQKGIKI